MSKKIGYLSLILSFAIWGAIAFLPFFELNNKVQIGIVMYAISYLLFFISGFLLGKELLQKTMSRIKGFFFRNKTQCDQSE